MPFLSSITSFFSPSSDHGQGSKRATMNSTFDAFSLPTTSHAGLGSQLRDVPSAADSVSGSPGPSRRSSYAYPPPAEAYRPAMAYFPPLSHTFHRLRNALADSFPELLETLNPPADAILLAQFEAELGCPLPPPVRDSFLIADGQDLEASNGTGGLFFGLHLLPLEEVVREWQFWRQAEDDPSSGQNEAVLATMASVPPGWIKSLYACRGWLPLITDRSGNYIGVDLDPGQGGSWGQVIIFGRDFDRKCVIYKGEGDGGWGKWLASFTDELESGDGWEAEKSSSSDEEDEVGYTSYTGGGSYGESGRGLRLAGEYKGWNVLEAWWDKSVSKWETQGLGMDIEAIERGLEEARRLAGVEGEAKGKEREAIAGSRTAEMAAQEKIPVYGSPQLQAPPTPTPNDSDALLPPASPDVLSTARIPKIRHPAPSPVRVITPVNALDHPLKSADLLSPPVVGAPRQKRQSRAPAPTPLDLPTRADMQAMNAIATAETSGLRGGWIMHTDTSSSSAARRSQAGSSSMSASSSRMGNGTGYRQSIDAEMVEIDLEGGQAAEFGSPTMSHDDLAAQYREERLSLSGLEHRRSSPVISPHHSRPTSPSPLSIETTMPYDYDSTPRATPREGNLTINPSPTSFAATSPIRPPPRLGSHSDRGMRATTPDGEGKDKEVVRGNDRIHYERERHRPRGERESSVTSSVGSQDGLLNGSGTSSRANSPPPHFISPASSPAPISPTQTAIPDLMSPTPTMSSTTSGESIGKPLPHPQPPSAKTPIASRHKPTGSIVAQRKQALEAAMGGLDVNGKR